jgi:hypothetical protein
MTFKSMVWWSRMAAFVVLGTVAGAAPDDVTSFGGRWDATVVVNGVEVPFAFEIVAEGTALKGSFFNGERRITSTSSRVENGLLVLSFDQYASRLQVSSEEGRLVGEYQRGSRGAYPFTATRAPAVRPVAGDAPSIGGRGSCRPTAPRASPPGDSSSSNPVRR